ncbi:hypothetical protein JCM12296A_34390 [Desulfosarcina cetonica]
MGAQGNRIWIGAAGDGGGGFKRSVVSAVGEAELQEKSDGQQRERPRVLKVGGGCRADRPVAAGRAENGSWRGYTRKSNDA